MKDKEWLDNFLKFKSYIFTATQKYQNIKIYDFQVADEIIYNLDNYKDITHYHQDINLWMLNKIKEEKYMVKNVETVEKNNKNIYEGIKNYIVPSLVGENR